MLTESSRAQMVSQQVRAWEVLDPRVLDLMERVPREQFVPPQWRSVALADTRIPLGHGQRMLAPSVVGRILQALDLQGGESVLEIGSGSGYLTACLASSARQVRSLEIFGDVTDFARANLRACGLGNVEVVNADGSQLAERDAYDVVVLTASLPQDDPRYREALRLGGRLFLAVGEPPIMDARLVRHVAANAFSTTSLFETLIEPLEHARTPEAFRF